MQALYTITENGNIHKQLDIPETFPTSAVSRMIVRWSPGFHPDKLSDGPDDPRWAVVNMHARRIIGFKEWFKDDQQRYFYDK